MNFKKIIRTISVSLLLTLSASPVVAQDLLARQAPVDRKARKVDTLALQKLINTENLESPAADLYDEWNNVYAHKAKNVPDSFRISLRNFCMPTVSRVVTSNFGSRWGRQHKGIDIKVYIGDTIRAAFSGKVRMVKYNSGGYGKYIVIRHPNGLETIYGHLSKQLVSEDQEVRAGDVIGLGGNTGRSTGSHLHFETRLCGLALNPALMFDFRNQDVVGDYYVFNSRTHDRESIAANELRGKIGNGGYTREQVVGEGYASAAKTEVVSQEKLYHKVAKGETLSVISKKRGVSIDQICKLNHIRKNIKIKPGMILRYS